MPNRIPEGFNILETIKTFYDDRNIDYEPDSLEKLAKLVSEAVPYNAEMIKIDERMRQYLIGQKLLEENTEIISYEEVEKLAKFFDNLKYGWAGDLYLELSRMDLAKRDSEEAIKLATKHLNAYINFVEKIQRHVPPIHHDILDNLETLEPVVKEIYPKIKEFREKEAKKPKQKSAMDKYLEFISKGKKET